jgi:hypothetical protein
MERLMASPYVVSSFAHCGQSVLTEFAQSLGCNLLIRRAESCGALATTVLEFWLVKICAATRKVMDILNYNDPGQRLVSSWPKNSSDHR